MVSFIGATECETISKSRSWASLSLSYVPVRPCGERGNQTAVRRGLPALDQMRYPPRDHFSFARAGAGDDQQRGTLMDDRFELLIS